MRSKAFKIGQHSVLFLSRGDDPAGRTVLAFQSHAQALHHLRRLMHNPMARMQLRSLSADHFGTEAALANREPQYLRRLASRLVSGHLRIAVGLSDRQRAIEEDMSTAATDLLSAVVEAAVSDAPVTRETREYVPARPIEEINRYWIEIELVGEDDQPIPNEPFEIRLPDQTMRKGRLDGDGYARVSLIRVAGECDISFPRLDAEAWEKIATLEER